ncbi:MAG TPA: cbb3-type cytochrome oxidase assembly protein [Holophagaceae bacterium]|nr:cbb3-type cytochrome oxidase assembly protein [Holophagaceae bacterium]
MEHVNWTLVIVFTAVGLAFAVGFVLMAVWAIRAGQFKDVEGVKYRMLEDFNPRSVKKDADGFRS